MTEYTKLEEYEFFQNDKGGVSSLVGYSSTAIRSVRYKFTTPAEGASKLTFSKGSNGLSAGTAYDLQFLISTDPDMAGSLNPSFAGTGAVTMTGKEGSYYTAAGSMEGMILLPNTDYYLYIYPATAKHCMFSWNYASTVTLTLDGAAGVVRIKEGDRELIALPVVKQDGAFINLAATVKVGGEQRYCV